MTRLLALRKLKIKTAVTCVAVALTVLVASPSLCLAQQTQIKSEYYTIDDQGVSTPLPSWQEPQEVLKTLSSVVDQALSLSLLNWISHSGDPAIPATPYHRSRHFGGWTNDRTDNNCYNTRTKILIRDSEDSVTLDPKNKCAVSTGKWLDPYTDTYITKSKETQIDHVVPLKNAYISGAHRWLPQQRCLYSNFMASPYHLLTVSGIQNQTKGSRTPAEYMPPNEKEACSYLQYWLKIKMAWGLHMTFEEASAIETHVENLGCNTQMMKISEKELKGIRQSMQKWGACENFTGQLPKLEEGS